MIEIPHLGTWLIAVSSGPDSMALLHMCLEEKIPCAVAHVNYHVRAQAEEEERYIQSFCEEKHIPCHILNKPFEYEGNFEANARNYRYDFFRKLIQENHYCGVLVGHHQDDLIETYLMQKEKHLVVKTYGLAKENHWKEILVYRPLLDYSKKTLVEYCKKNHIQYYEDHTNEDSQYVRNRIRKEVINYSKEKRDSILEEIKVANQELFTIRQEAHLHIREGKVRIDDYRNQKEEVRYTILRFLIEKKNQANYSLKHIQSIDEIILHQCDFVIDVHNQYLVQEKGRMFVVDSLEPYTIVFSSKEDMMPHKHPWFSIEEGKPGVYAVTFLEEDFPITIRNAREKDAILMRFGTKSVHRFFIDRHIPLYLRRVWPVVVNSKGTIILVPGLGCDIHHYSINPDCNVIK
ncbi:MAG: tRNA lysidine(34) synthetase TilS [Solobacterium sp.]|nr:tRNA lysidine(34) synthetase TilS [Solobacterium sp.]